MYQLKRSESQVGKESNRNHDLTQTDQEKPFMDFIWFYGRVWMIWIPHVVPPDPPSFPASHWGGQYRSASYLAIFWKNSCSVPSSFRHRTKRLHKRSAEISLPPGCFLKVPMHQSQGASVWTSCHWSFSLLDFNNRGRGSRVDTGTTRSDVDLLTKRPNLMVPAGLSILA